MGRSHRPRVQPEAQRLCPRELSAPREQAELATPAGCQRQLRGLRRERHLRQQEHRRRPQRGLVAQRHRVDPRGIQPHRLGRDRAATGSARDRHPRRRLQQPGLLADRDHRVPDAGSVERAQCRRFEESSGVRRHIADEGDAHDQDRGPALSARDRLPQLAAQQRHLQLQRPVHGRSVRGLPAWIRIVGEPLEVREVELPHALYPLLRAGRLANERAAHAQPWPALRAELPVGRSERRDREFRSGYRSAEPAHRACGLGG